MPTNTKDWFKEQANRDQFRCNVAALARKQCVPPYSEAPGNFTKYGHDLSFNGTAWCAVFVSWVYKTASAQLDVPNPLAGLQTAFGMVHVTSTWTLAVAKRLAIPKAAILLKQESVMIGDIVCWDHDNVPGGPGHTGIVTKVSSKLFVTAEGNTDQGFSRTGGQTGLHEHTLLDGKHGMLLGVIRPTRRFS